MAEKEQTLNLVRILCGVFVCPECKKTVLVQWDKEKKKYERVTPERHCLCPGSAGYFLHEKQNQN